mmetsp:Transcript_4152/g.13000  ORF Transcript_4152/g.13000 Transcript_4152/m.13000 type:complete len:155 (+) Transcript_4152:1828-2292(+)
MIREPPQRNSGVVGGNFLAKMKLKHPDGKLVTAADLVIGATLTLASHSFIILDADEATLKYMEQRPEQFPYSDHSAVKNMYADLARVAWPTDAARQSALNKALPNIDAINFDQLQLILASLVPVDFPPPPKQAAITLWRCLAKGGVLLIRELPF